MAVNPAAFDDLAGLLDLVCARDALPEAEFAIVTSERHARLNKRGLFIRPPADDGGISNRHPKSCIVDGFRLSQNRNGIRRLVVLVLNLHRLARDSDAKDFLNRLLSISMPCRSTPNAPKNFLNWKRSQPKPTALMTQFSRSRGLVKAVLNSNTPAGSERLVTLHDISQARERA